MRGVLATGLCQQVCIVSVLFWCWCLNKRYSSHCSVFHFDLFYHCFECKAHDYASFPQYINNSSELHYCSKVCDQFDFFFIYKYYSINFLQNIYFTNKCCSFELNYLFIKKFIIVSTQKKLSTQLFLTSIIRNMFRVTNQHIRMISEGSCDSVKFCITGTNYNVKYT